MSLFAYMYMSSTANKLVVNIYKLEFSDFIVFSMWQGNSVVFT